MGIAFDVTHGACWEALFLFIPVLPDGHAYKSKPRSFALRPLTWKPQSLPQKQAKPSEPRWISNRTIQQQRKSRKFLANIRYSSLLGLGSSTSGRVLGTFHTTKAHTVKENSRFKREYAIPLLIGNNANYKCLTKIRVIVRKIFGPNRNEVTEQCEISYVTQHLVTCKGHLELLR